MKCKTCETFPSVERRLSNRQLLRLCAKRTDHFQLGRPARRTGRILSQTLIAPSVTSCHTLDGQHTAASTHFRDRALRIGVVVAGNRLAIERPVNAQRQVAVGHRTGAGQILIHVRGSVAEGKGDDDRSDCAIYNLMDLCENAKRFLS